MVCARVGRTKCPGAGRIRLAEDFVKAALDYHRYPTPGKLSVEPTKRMATQRDLALAYSPGVAAACQAIMADPEAARDLTARGNLVAVISNGTAVLGLGNIGALAGKPVMEGKAVLFKKFAGIDVFDIEVDAADPDLFVDVVAALEPTFGAINLEDIKAPECFEIERRLRDRMKIPVFHDDQHGTAIVCAAAVTNGLLLQGKSLKDVRLVTSGAGAAALACVDLLVSMGLRIENVTLTDIKGVVHAGRGDEMAPNMARYARDTTARTLGDALPGTDVFLGLSAPRVLKPEWLATMADRPIILALANPEPEITPELAREARPDALIATGRSDYPNQVNNVLCFPFIFRGALDVGATNINEAMKIAAVEAIAELARIEVSEVVASAYGGQAPVFGPDYIIPKPFDPRLILQVAPAVAKAAMDSGVSRSGPIADFDAYARDLERFVFRSGQLMRPVFEAARLKPPTRRLCRRRGRSGAAGRADRHRRESSRADPDRPRRRHRGQSGRARTAAASGRRGDGARSGGRPRDLRVSDGSLPETGRSPRCAARSRGAAHADPMEHPGRHAAPGRACRRGARGRYRRLVASPHLRPADRPGEGRGRARLCDVGPDPAERGAVHLRHACQPRPDRRTGRRDDTPRGRRGASLRRGAQGRPPVAFELRRVGVSERQEDATGARLSSGHRRRTSRSMARCTPMRP